MSEDDKAKVVTTSRQMSKKEDENHNLIGTIHEMRDSLNTMNEIIQKANFIALNASIEAARTQTQSENFSLVADQVKRQAERTEELASSLGTEVSALEGFALRATAINCTDVANDVIDKIDRNLFERNCDMQAWAQFVENVDCARALLNKDQKTIRGLYSSIKEGNSSDPLCEKVNLSCERLELLVDTYNVYLDSFLINNQGIVCATAKNKKLIGLNLSHQAFVKASLRDKEIHVSDMYYDTYLNAYTVSYTAPVLDEKGQAIGMLSNRFNWKYVVDIIDKMPTSSDDRLNIISEDGTVLCSKNKLGILKDTLVWLESGVQAINERSGYSVETERNGRNYAWGYCHTFGFNAYPGKKWSCIFGVPIQLSESTFIAENISREHAEKRNASPQANAALQIIAEKIQDRVKNINNINNETNMLAVNAAIQAGVAGAEGEAFSVIASEIGQLARQSEDFVHSINQLTRSLEESVRNTVYRRLGEAAFDAIDKIDRNLFERFCDIQAFASFDEIIRFETIEISEVIELLRRLHEIYEVYHDIFLLNLDGKIVASAQRPEIIGRNQGDREWFREAMTGEIVVSDFYFSKSIDAYTITYATPVKDHSGKVIAVMTTRFNCDVVYDILRSTIVGESADIFLINPKGVVIGSLDGEGILETNLANTKAYRQMSKEKHGYILEGDSKNGETPYAIGFAKSMGYLTFAGKNWAVLIRQETSDRERDLEPAAEKEGE